MRQYNCNISETTMDYKKIIYTAVVIAIIFENSNAAPGMDTIHIFRIVI